MMRTDDDSMIWAGSKKFRQIISGIRHSWRISRAVVSVHVVELDIKQRVGLVLWLSRFAVYSPLHSLQRPRSTATGAW